MFDVKRFVADRQNWFAVAILCYSLVNMHYARNLAGQAALVPRIFLVALIVIVVSKILYTLVFERTEAGGDEEEEIADPKEKKAETNVFLVIIFMIFFLVMFRYIGFFSSLLIFSITFLRFIGKLKWPQVFIITGTLFAFIFVLSHFLHISFSIGYLF